MLKILTLFCFALATTICYAQKTETPITGIDSIKLGDSISQVNNYGFSFIAIAKYRLTDSVQIGSVFPKQPLLSNKAEAAETNTEYIYLDSGKTFCPDVSVFITNSFNINQIQHSKTATLALTYFKNVLIEIRIIDSPKQIKANYMYGLKKYGKGFVEQMDGYTLHDQARSRAVNPNAKMPPPRDLSKVPIATIAKELSESFHTESIYWVNGNYSFAYRYCSEPYQFWVEKNLPNTEYGTCCGCAEHALIIRNDKAYKAMTVCSDKTLKQMISK